MGVRQYVRQLRAIAATTMLALVGCNAIVGAGEAVAGGAAEVIVCPVDLINCGHVYLCEKAADNELGHVEICIDDDDDIALAEAVYGTCEPTPRHQGLCESCCGDDCGRGCNAFNGCFCPETP